MKPPAHPGRSGARFGEERPLSPVPSSAQFNVAHQLHPLLLLRRENVVRSSTGSRCLIVVVQFSGVFGVLFVPPTYVWVSFTLLLKDSLVL